jgi:hypothetical protein
MTIARKRGLGVGLGPALRERSKNAYVSGSERGLLRVRPALQLPLSGECITERREGFGVDDLDGASLSGPRCALAAVVVGNASLEVLAGSDIERAVGATENVGVEGQGGGLGQRSRGLS